MVEVVVVALGNPETLILPEMNLSLAPRALNASCSLLRMHVLA